MNLLLLLIITLLIGYSIFKDILWDKRLKKFLNHIADLELRIKARDSDSYAAYKAVASEESPEKNLSEQERVQGESDKNYLPTEEVKREHLLPAENQSDERNSV